MYVQELEGLGQALVDEAAQAQSVANHLARRLSSDPCFKSTFVDSDPLGIYVGVVWATGCTFPPTVPPMVGGIRVLFMTESETPLIVQSYAEPYPVYVGGGPWWGGGLWRGGGGRPRRPWHPRRFGPHGGGPRVLPGGGRGRVGPGRRGMGPPGGGPRVLPGGGRVGGRPMGPPGQQGGQGRGR